MAAPTTTKLAPLETISYDRLLSGSSTEHARLLAAARSPGFFYLDLRAAATTHYLTAVDDLYKAAATYFALPEDTKMADFREDVEYGYKPSPLDASLELPFDVLSAPLISAGTPTPGSIPAPLSGYTAPLHSFSTLSHTIAHTLLISLATSLDLVAALSAAHAPRLPSASGTKLVCEPLQPTVASVLENKHTDGGSLTLLFCREWGTQLCLCDGEEQEWGFIEPREGCAVVNVADSLARLTGGRWGPAGESGDTGGLRSALHRVTQPRDGAAERVFVLYFLRPGRGAE